MKMYKIFILLTGNSVVSAMTLVELFDVREYLESLQEQRENTTVRKSSKYRLCIRYFVGFE